MSFPPGTEMFQFPGFASYHLCIQCAIPIAGWVAPFGYPRINACSRLPVAFRSVPRPSSPPGAKASTECPSYTRYSRTVQRPHGLTAPCTETIHPEHASQTGIEVRIKDSSCSCLSSEDPHGTRSVRAVTQSGFSPLNPSPRHDRGPRLTLSPAHATEERIQSDKSFTTPLNPRHARPLGAARHPHVLHPPDSPIPGQTYDRTTGPRERIRIQPVLSLFQLRSHAPRDAPEPDLQ